MDERDRGRQRPRDEKSVESPVPNEPVGDEEIAEEALADDGIEDEEGTPVGAGDTDEADRDEDEDEPGDEGRRRIA